MALPFLDSSRARDRDPRTLSILAKSIYRELRGNGFEACDVVALASELLEQLAADVAAAQAATADETAPASGEVPLGGSL